VGYSENGTQHYAYLIYDALKALEEHNQ